MFNICKKFHILKESHWIDEQESYRLVIKSLRLRIIKSLKSDTTTEYKSKHSIVFQEIIV